MKSAFLEKALLGLILLASVTATHAARTHAVLVGVTTYPSLEKDAQLRGPRNDVQMFLDLLLERGVARQDIRIVADGFKGAAVPTRQAILGTLNDMAARVVAGDFVFLFVAGHGSQQPAAAQADEEPDGFDEIFLPRDIGRWDGDAAAVTNAITDDELGAAITRLRNQGAFVWAVFDACHSGTLTRAQPLPGRRDRQVTPESLGVDSATLAKSRKGTTRARPMQMELDPSTTTSVGQYVAMYAAQSYETTPEYALPEGTPGAVQRGLFSYTLHQVLTAHPDITYRQAIEQVTQRYLARGIEHPSPNYEGTGMDSVVFGALPGIHRTQWRIDRQDSSLKLRAGIIHEVSNESILAVVSSPAAADDKLIGYVKVTRARATDADVVPIAFAGRAPFKAALIGRSAYARPVELKIDTRLRVGMPVKAGRCEAAHPAVLQAITQLRSAGRDAERLQWVPAADLADVRLCQMGTQLLFLDSSANIDADSRRLPLGFDVTRAAVARDDGSLSSVAVELQTQLLKMARVVNLARVATGSIGAAAAQPATTVTWQQRCPDGVRDCQVTARQVMPTSRPDLRGGDRFSVRIDNPLRQPVDVTILYIDAAYGIAPLYPELGTTPRIEPLGRLERTFTVNAVPNGLERMLVIAVPAAPQSPSVDFTSLAQEGMPQLAQRSGQRSGLLELYENAVLGATSRSTTRGASSSTGTDTSATTVVTYLWNVLPEQPTR